MLIKDDVNIFQGVIKAMGQLAVTIRQKNGKGWYGPINELSNPVINELKKGLDLKVSFNPDYSKSYGKNKYGLRYLARNINLTNQLDLQTE